VHVSIESRKNGGFLAGLVPGWDWRGGLGQGCGGGQQDGGTANEDRSNHA
jgi:hypothetical protein